MKKCQRCGSSVLLDFTDAAEAGHAVWKCLGCGHEVFYDPDRQAEDERVLAHIRREEVGSGARRAASRR